MMTTMQRETISLVEETKKELKDEMHNFGKYEHKETIKKLMDFLKAIQQDYAF